MNKIFKKLKNYPPAKPAPKNEKPLLGGGGVEDYAFIVKSAGTETFQMIHCRPWMFDKVCEKGEDGMYV